MMDSHSCPGDTLRTHTLICNRRTAWNERIAGGIPDWSRGWKESTLHQRFLQTGCPSRRTSCPRPQRRLRPGEVRWLTSGDFPVPRAQNWPNCNLVSQNSRARDPRHPGASPLCDASPFRPPGKRVGILETSGAGKSTLVNLTPVSLIHSEAPVAGQHRQNAIPAHGPPEAIRDRSTRSNALLYFSTTLHSPPNSLRFRLHLR